MKIVIGICVVGFFIALIYGFFIASCHLRWSGTGHDVKYNIFAGCLVKQDNNKYIPESGMRGEGE